jgi:uncharacterized protein
MGERAFLTAQWRDLVLVTYRVGADLVAPRLPAGLEPDRLPGDAADVAYLSLVAFRFVDTRVLGIPVPLHRDFPEVNLRVYARTTDPPGTPEAGRRGVFFIAEIVPRAMISTIANLVYHEHYRTMPLTVEARDTDDGHRELHCAIEDGDRTHTLRARGRRPPIETATDGLEHFFKEHEWGFSTDGEGQRVTYRVAHPVWRVFPLSPSHLELSWRFGELYGDPWQALDDLEPFHVAFAEGSEIAVYPLGD